MSTQTKEVQQWHTFEDGFDNLTRGTAPMPTPGQDEVLVQIKAVSLNYRDTEVTNGEYNHYEAYSRRTTPLVPCSDALGIITAVGPLGSGASEPAWKVGDRVLSTFCQSHLTGQITAKHLASALGKPLDGVLQTYRVFPSTGLVRVPEYLTDEEASCLPIAAVTAWMAIFGMEPFGTWAKTENNGKKPLQGKTVLLEGTGGVAIAGLQIAKAAGARTIITSSSDEKLRRAKEELGADHVINYKTTPDWEKKVMEITGENDGADIILETGGAGTLYKALDCIAFGGLISCIGYTAGKEDSGEGSRMNVNVLALRRTVTLKGIINGPRDRFEEMCEFYQKHEIRPVVDKVFGFEEGKEAIKYLRSGSHFGKVVVKVE
ncbi:alcohol dehydrogenase [Neurospora intermedia]|uniref:Alcohol dehydrogenase n=1 Tax=Neurospora intermedia TaxID=5142 RepID=A0ABR3DHJ0_NEUIN